MVSNKNKPTPNGRSTLGTAKTNLLISPTIDEKSKTKVKEVINKEGSIDDMKSVVSHRKGFL